MVTRKRPCRIVTSSYLGVGRLQTAVKKVFSYLAAAIGAAFLPSPNRARLPCFGLARPDLRMHPRATVTLSVMPAGAAHEARRSCGQRGFATEAPQITAYTDRRICRNPRFRDWRRC